MGKFLHSFFSPLGFRRAVPQVWDGFQTNIKLMVIAELLVLVFALVFAIVRGLPGRATLPLRVFAIAYTDFFRGTPLILVAYVWGFGIPALHAGIISSQSLFIYGRSTGPESSPFTRASGWRRARSGSRTPRH